MSPAILSRLGDVIHPADRAMRQRLEAIPALQAAVKAYMKYTSDRTDRFQLVTQGLRLGPQQFGDIHRLLLPICAVLGMPEPELFLSGGDFDASTQGTTVVRSRWAVN